MGVASLRLMGLTGLISCLRRRAPRSRLQGRDVWVCRATGLTVGTGLKDTTTCPPMSQEILRRVSMKT